MPIRNLFIIGLTAIISLTCYNTASKNRYANMFAEALLTIEGQALQVVPQDELFKSAMLGMTSRLDGHSTFISGKNYQRFNEDLNQTFGGVGMYVENHPSTGKLTVLAPIPGGPADKNGIQAGDVIVSIDGKPAENIDRAKAIGWIRGPQGDPVSVEIERNGTVQKMELIRQFIHEPSVRGDYRNADGSWNYHLKQNSQIGYIRLIQFGKKSAEEIHDVLERLNGKVDGLILDLRNNSGGLLTVAIEICDYLLPADNLVVSIKGRKGKVEEEHYSRRRPVFDPEIPIVVLINRNSASASEIVSACLQDHDRATLVGESTWGKGTVQRIIDILRDKSALKLTTASYWRPSGQYIDRYDEAAIKTGKWGVHPDEEGAVELNEEQVFQNLRLRNLLDLRGLISDQELKERDQDQLSGTEDIPLTKAVQLLKNH